MDQITHDVRTVQWAEIVRRCHERPEKQTAKQWLADNDINEKQFYYWQRRLRNLAARGTKISLPAKQAPTDISFVEIPASSGELDELQQQSFTNQPDAVIRIGKVEIDLHNSISEELLSKILKVVSYAR